MGSAGASPKNGATVQFGVESCDMIVSQDFVICLLLLQDFVQRFGLFPWFHPTTQPVSPACDTPAKMLMESRPWHVQICRTFSTNYESIMVADIPWGAWIRNFPPITIKHESQHSNFLWLPFSHQTKTFSFFPSKNSMSQDSQVPVFTDDNAGAG